MAQRTFPLDGIEYYSADMRMFHAGRTGGVINYTGDDFGVSDVSGMSVTIGKGAAYLKTGSDSIGGVVYANDDAYTLTIDPAGSSDRYDYIAIRYDSDENDCRLIKVKGGAAMPSPVRSETIWELILYIVKVPANVNALSGGDILDQRLNENLCGLAVDTLAQVPTQELYARFGAFMDRLEKELSGDVAGNLLDKINDLEDDFRDIRSDLNSFNTMLPEITGTITDVKNLQINSVSRDDFQWKFLGQVDGKRSVNISVPNWRERYSEFMITCTNNAAPGRVLASTVIPMYQAELSLGLDESGGASQVLYAANIVYGGGCSFITTDTIKIYSNHQNASLCILLAR